MRCCPVRRNVVDVVLQSIHFFNCTDSVDARLSAIAVSSSRVVIANCFFERNGIPEDRFGGADGGAVAVYGTSVVTVEQSEFRRNGGSFGGAMYITGTSRGRLSQVNFTENRAVRAGGALMLSRDAHVDADEIIFERNHVSISAGFNGGAVSFHASRTNDNLRIDNTRPGLVFNLKNSICRGNSALLGGCLHAVGNARVEITDSLIYNNSAKFLRGYCWTGLDARNASFSGE